MQDDHAVGNGAARPFNPPPRFNPPRDTDEFGRPLPMTEEQRRARVALWEETVRKLEEITDETDDDEAWDEFSRSLGMDPETGRGLAP
jgi:hypothetical protein